MKGRISLKSASSPRVRGPIRSGNHRLPILHWADLPKHHGRPLAVVRATNHPAYPSHRHEFWEIVIVYRGSGLMSFGCRTLPIRVGDVFVLSRGQRHAYFETRSLDVINILFDPAYVGSVHPVLADWMQHESLVSVGPCWQPGEVRGECLHLGSSDFALLLDKVGRMEAELKLQKPENRISALAYFLLIITMLRRQSRPWEGAGSAVAGHRVSRSLQYLEEHFSDPITIGDIISCSQVSRRHFFRLFEQAVGVTPMDYLKKLRLQKAASLLLTTSSPVTQVAFDCGFNDSNYFSSMYRKEYGLSPTQFRKRGQRD